MAHDAHNPLALDDAQVETDEGVRESQAAFNAFEGERTTAPSARTKATAILSAAKSPMTHSTLKPLERRRVQSLSRTTLSVEVERMRHASGPDYRPSAKMVLHLAAMKAKETRVIPEMIAAKADSDEGGLSQIDGTMPSYTAGPNSLGALLHKWTYQDCDIPRQMQLEEQNQRARKEMRQGHFRLDPDCAFRQAWDVAQVVILLYMAVSLPITVGFSLPEPPLGSVNFWIQLLIDLYFVVDIYLSFVTCIYDEHGGLVTDRREIFAAYVQSWFLLDVFSVLPVGYLVYFDLEEAISVVANATTAANHSVQVVRDSRGVVDVGIVKLVKLMRLIKLLRLARLKRLLKKYENHFYELFIRLRTIRLLATFFLIAHWLACVYYFMGTLEVNSWVVQWVKQRYSVDDESTVDDAPLEDRYLVNFYSAIGTLITGSTPSGISDPFTAPLAELLFSVFAVVIGGFVYGSIIGNMTELTRRRNMVGDIPKMKVAEARAMCLGRADVFLTEKIMNQVKNHLENMPPLDVPDFLNNLTGDLEMEFATQLGWVSHKSHGTWNYGMLHKVPFFTLLDNKSKILICSKMRYLSFEPFDNHTIQALQAGEGKPITVEATAGTDMFIIVSGKVAVVKHHKRIGVLETHQMFGEYAVLKPPRIHSFGELHTRTHYAIEDTAIVVALGYDDLMDLRRERAEINDAVLPYVKEAMHREVHLSDWFYVEILQAANLEAVDHLALAHNSASDPYVVMFVDDHMIGKTEVEFATVNPVWGQAFAFGRGVTESYGLDAVLRFEIYDYDDVNDALGIAGAKSLGTAHCKLTDLVGADGCFAKDAKDLVLKLPILDDADLKAELLRSGLPTHGSTERTLTIQASNENASEFVPHMDFKTEPSVSADTERRRIQQIRRAEFLSDDSASLAELKQELAEVKGQVSEILSLLRKDTSV